MGKEGDALRGRQKQQLLRRKAGVWRIVMWKRCWQQLWVERWSCNCGAIQRCCVVSGRAYQQYDLPVRGREAKDTQEGKDFLLHVLSLSLYRFNPTVHSNRPMVLILPMSAIHIINTCLRLELRSSAGVALNTPLR
jgi:hypothetical protein